MAFLEVDWPEVIEVRSYVTASVRHLTDDRVVRPPYDPVMTRMEENRFWFALASSDALLFARGLKHAYRDLDVTIRELDVAPLQIQGPKSKDLMRDLVGEGILDLKYYWWRPARIAGIPVVITRTGHSPFSISLAR